MARSLFRRVRILGRYGSVTTEYRYALTTARGLLTYWRNALTAAWETVVTRRGGTAITWAGTAVGATPTGWTPAMPAAGAFVMQVNGKLGWTSVGKTNAASVLIDDASPVSTTGRIRIYGRNNNTIGPGFGSAGPSVGLKLAVDATAANGFSGVHVLLFFTMGSGPDLGVAQVQRYINVSLAGGGTGQQVVASGAGVVNPGIGSGDLFVYDAEILADGTFRDRLYLASAVQPQWTVQVTLNAAARALSGRIGLHHANGGGGMELERYDGFGNFPIAAGEHSIVVSRLFAHAVSGEVQFNAAGDFAATGARSVVEATGAGFTSAGRIHMLSSGDTWRALALSNGAVGTLAYRRLADGSIYLRGAVERTSGVTPVVATLGTVANPDTAGAYYTSPEFDLNLVAYCLDNATTGYVTIRAATGNIEIPADFLGGFTVQLDGLHFPTAVQPYSTPY